MNCQVSHRMGKQKLYSVYSIHNNRWTITSWESYLVREHLEKCFMYLNLNVGHRWKGQFCVCGQGSFSGSQVQKSRAWHHLQTPKRQHHRNEGLLFYKQRWCNIYPEWRTSIFTLWWTTTKLTCNLYSSNIGKPKPNYQEMFEKC